MTRFRGRLIALVCFAGLSTCFGSAHATQSGTWDPLNHALCTDSQPCFSPKAALLLTDGTVIINEQCSSRWFQLTPDINGSYRNGSWSQIASLPTGYAPLYFASQVLPDGRVIINGGGVQLMRGSLDDSGSDLRSAWQCLDIGCTAKWLDHDW